MSRLAVVLALAAGCTQVPARSSLEAWKHVRLGDVHFECDVPLGNSSTWWRDIDPDNGSVSGSISVFRRGYRWQLVPFAQVALVDDTDATNPPQAAYFIVHPTRDGYRAHIAVINAPSKEPTELDPVGLDLDDVRRFELRWRGYDVQLRFNPNPSWITIPAAFKPHRLRLRCDSAIALFHSVSLQAPDARSGFDCQAPAGRFSSWSRTIDSPRGSVTGTLAILRTRDEGWPPEARVFVGCGDDRDDALGFAISFERDAKMLTAAWWSSSTPEVALPAVPFGRVPFALRWKGDTVDIKLGARGRWTRLPSKVRPDRLWLDCSSAQVDFSDVAVATAPQ